MSTRRLLGGRYEIGEVIGRGGMADVHAGFDTRLSRPVAIKLLRSDLARDSVFLSRFRREAQSAAGLNHPNIVAIYDSGEDESLDPTTGVTVHVPYIVMEVVDGRTLREHLTATGPMGAVEAGRIVEDVLAALDYSHSKGIVHRDIKPANVMLDRSGTIKLIDFNLTRPVGRETTISGSVQYLPPDVLAHGPIVDPMVDRYALGALLFELVTGDHPYLAEFLAGRHPTMRSIPADPSELRPGVDQGLGDFLTRAVMPADPARFASAEQMRCEWWQLEPSIRGLNMAAGVP